MRRGQHSIASPQGIVFHAYLTGMDATICLGLPDMVREREFCAPGAMSPLRRYMLCYAALMMHTQLVANCAPWVSQAISELSPPTPLKSLQANTTPEFFVYACDISETAVDILKVCRTRPVCLSDLMRMLLHQGALALHSACANNPV